MAERPCAGGKPLVGACKGSASIVCGSCGAIHYCSSLHQRLHWAEHKQECRRYQGQMQSGAVVHDFPFSFTHEATFLIDKGSLTRCSFFQSYGLHALGLWHSECECKQQNRSHSSPDACTKKITLGWHLLPSLCPCRGASDEKRRLVSWADYYGWRGLHLDSPVAILLHWPLTLYHGLMLMEDATGSSHKLAKERGSLLIHYLGPEKELDQVEVFGELHSLLLSQHIHIDFIGPAVSSSRDGEQLQLRRLPQCIAEECACKLDAAKQEAERFVSIRFWKGLYHSVYRDLSKHGGVPDFIIAPNAGVAAFPSWLPTLELLGHLKVPTIFTDFCEEAAILASKCIEHTLCYGATVPVQLNPFRQPITPPNKSLDLPTYSNCYLLGIS